jgi:hypothetical protein
MISKKSKIIFLMPPKTASNSLTESLLDSSIKFEEFGPSYRLPKIHLFLSEIVKLFNVQDIENYKVVQLVRDPYHRFASTYFHQIKLLPNKHHLKRLNFNDFSIHFLNSLKKGDFLNNFFIGTQFMNKSILSGKSWGGARTYLQQTQWNDLGVDIKYIKLQDGIDVSEELTEHLGIYIPEMPLKNVNKNDINYDDILTDEIMDIIYQVYYEDFIKLDY